MLPATVAVACGMRPACRSYFSCCRGSYSTLLSLSSPTFASEHLQAMQLDERDQTRQMGKNLRRRAKAFAQTKEFEAATRDLTIAAKLEPEEWAKDPVSRGAPVVLCITALRYTCRHRFMNRACV